MQDPYCGDEVCTAGEDCESCSVDCGGCTAPALAVSPPCVARGVGCVTESLWGFTRSSAASCHAVNAWAQADFLVGLDGGGSATQSYCPSGDAGVGSYELWCVDDATGQSSNHAAFEVTP